MADPTLTAAIANFKQASALAVQWTNGADTVDVPGTAGAYPSLAKLVKQTKDALTLFYTNPVMLGNAGAVLPHGTTAQRSASVVKGTLRYNDSLNASESFGAHGWLSLENVVISSYSGVVGVLSGTSKIPIDNTAPLVTEGTQVFSKQVTPKVIGSVMQIEFSAMYDTSVAAQAVAFTVWRDTTLIGVFVMGSTAVAIPVIGTTTWKPGVARIQINDTTTSLNPVTYSVRIGLETSGTWYLGRGASITMGGNLNSHWKIDEVLPS